MRKLTKTVEKYSFYGGKKASLADEDFFCRAPNISKFWHNIADCVRMYAVTLIGLFLLVSNDNTQLLYPLCCLCCLSLQLCLILLSLF